MIPDLSVVVVIACVLIVSVIFDRLLVRPLMRALHERERIVRSAREVAETAAAQVRRGTDEVEGKTRVARLEVYRRMEEARHEAMARRSALLGHTREEVETALSKATSSLKAQAAEAKSRLDGEAAAIADQVVERVLGRRIS